MGEKYCSSVWTDSITVLPLQKIREVTEEAFKELELLLEKLDTYGVKPKSLEILWNTGRTAFVWSLEYGSKVVVAFTEEKP